MLVPSSRLAGRRPPLPPPRRCRRRLPCPPAASKSNDGGGGAISSLLLTFNQTASRLLAGPWRFAPSMLLPSAGGLSVVGSVYAPDAVKAVAGALPPSLVAALPAAPAVTSFYTAHAPQVDAALATTAGLIGVAAGFVLLPLLDALLGDESEGDLAPADAQSDTAFRAWVYAVGATHLALVVAGIAAAPALVAAHAGAGPVLAAAPVVAVALSAGTSGGVAFTAVHELVHGRTRLDRVGAAAVLSAACYGFWRDAHLAHHKHVGLHHDPATARAGETLYTFIPRSVTGAVADGLAADRARVAARGWTAARAPLWVAGPAAWLAVAAATGGAPSLAFFAIQAAGSVFLLETVNYIEHYGLTRRMVTSTSADGTVTRALPEKVAPRHSWNANTLATNAISFRLQRHSDHHAHAERPFHRLRDVPSAPQLPKRMGYSALMLLAAFAPAAFFGVMNPRVDAERARVAGLDAMVGGGEDE